METFAKTLLIAIPVFLLLIFLEYAYGVWKGKNNYRLVDVLSSLSSGITNLFSRSMALGITLVGYEYLYQHIRVYDIQSTWLVYAICFMVLDLAGYWYHRLAHEVNYFWNGHIIHHSSEDFNLAVALRQEFKVVFSLGAILLFPAAMLGIKPEVVAIVAPIQLYLQYWYHTQHIGKMGFLEHIIVTPSHHRVHHAINPVYMDKNYAQIFIFWDKLFGTFQEELPDQPPVYGITRPAGTWNPILINLQHLWLMVKDAWRARHWRDKLRIWFMPTGWRPADVAERYPVYSVKDPYQLEKYNPPVRRPVLVWSLVQLVFNFTLMMYIFSHYSEVGARIGWFAVYMFAAIYAYTSMLDGDRRAPWYELGKSIYGWFLIVYQGYNWFGMNQWFGAATAVVGAYLILSVAFTFGVMRPQAHLQEAV
jgi:alkylglycerol monooxygenase